jgi:tRNA A-37 threonylcarbamoyl transferase component Bud32
MSNPHLVHPDAEQLTAFGLGQLDEASLLEIESHLAECPACLEAAASVADDTLVGLLRSAVTETDDKPASQKNPTQTPTTCASPPAPAVPGLPPELAQHSRYRVAELLGVGGMGAVYKAEHLLMERPVALKVINRSLMDSPAMVERFRREVRAAARLTHPNIVHAYDAEQAGDTHFLVMEYVEGKSLAAVVAERGPLPVVGACEYIRQAALGLQHAHERGMVHRDVKPQNLMLTPEGQVKILDFGLARFARESAPATTPQEISRRAATPALEAVTQVGMVMGTPDYIAPEQACNAREADIRADIYSLGCTLYDLLAGHAPFPEGTPEDKVLAHVERMPRPLTDIRPDVPAELARVVERMLAKDPAARFQTPAEVAEALGPFTAAAPPRRRRRRLAAAVVLGIAAAATAAVLYVHTDKGEFVIETTDDSVAVMVNERGVKIKDQVSGREYLLRAGKQDVRTGVYEVLVSELPEGIEVTAPSLTVKRGGVVRAVARLRGLPDKGKLVNAFGTGFKPITRDGVTEDEGGWRINAPRERVVRLYEVQPPLEDSLVVYKARMKSASLMSFDDQSR